MKNVVNLRTRKSRFEVNGVTNREMIPMLKETIDIEDIGGLEVLKQEYPTIFESSLKYIGKKRLAKVQELLDFELPQAV